MDFNEIWELFIATLGCSGIIAALSTVFFSLKWRHNLRKKSKVLHRFLLAVFFGLLSIYGSAANPEVNGVLCNCSNIAPLYAGLVGGPIAGIGAGVIGMVFRMFAIGGEFGIPCGIGCLTSGLIGMLSHIAVVKKDRYSITVGACAAVISELVYCLLISFFGYSAFVIRIIIPNIASSLLGIMFCLYMYKSASYKWSKKYKENNENKNIVDNTEVAEQ